MKRNKRGHILLSQTFIEPDLMEFVEKIVKEKDTTKTTVINRALKFYKDNEADTQFKSLKKFKKR